MTNQELDQHCKVLKQSIVDLLNALPEAARHGSVAAHSEEISFCACDLITLEAEQSRRAQQLRRDA